MLGIFIKRPVDQIDYDVDFSRWLSEGDTLQSATAAVDPSDSMVSAIILPSGIGSEVVKVWVSGGASGKTAAIVVTAKTAQNRIKQTEFQIRVRELT